jgi:hypothetical protein
MSQNKEQVKNHSHSIGWVQSSKYPAVWLNRSTMQVAYVHKSSQPKDPFSPLTLLLDVAMISSRSAAAKELKSQDPTMRLIAAIYQNITRDPADRKGKPRKTTYCPWCMGAFSAREYRAHLPKCELRRVELTTTAKNKSQGEPQS